MCIRDRCTNEPKLDKHLNNIITISQTNLNNIILLKHITKEQKMKVWESLKIFRQNINNKLRPEQIQNKTKKR